MVAATRPVGPPRAVQRELPLNCGRSDDANDDPGGRRSRVVRWLLGSDGVAPRGSVAPILMIMALMQPVVAGPLSELSSSIRVRGTGPMPP
jgi:hypothetical protein